MSDLPKVMDDDGNQWWRQGVELVLQPSKRELLLLLEQACELPRYLSKWWFGSTTPGVRPTILNFEQSPRRGWCCWSAETAKVWVLSFITNLERKLGFPRFSEHIREGVAHTPTRGLNLTVWYPQISGQGTKELWEQVRSCSTLFPSSPLINIKETATNLFPCSDKSRARAEFLESIKTLNLAVQTSLPAPDLCPSPGFPRQLGLG